MSRQRLIDLICFRYGLTERNANQFVNDCFSRGYTWLDIIRKIDFNSKLSKYTTNL